MLSIPNTTDKRQRRNRLGLYSYKDVAALLGIDKTTVRYHVLKGDIPAPSIERGTQKFYGPAEVLSIQKYWQG